MNDNDYDYVAIFRIDRIKEYVELLMLRDLASKEVQEELRSLGEDKNFKSLLEEIAIAMGE